MNVGMGEREVDGYEYDLFISYKRGGDVEDWVHTHFVPMLRGCLGTYRLATRVRVFLDVEQEVGTYWPENLARALHRSHLLVPIWNPPYFESQWCLAEWRTMLRREEILRRRGKLGPVGLVYPVRFNDGEDFPEEAKNVQQEMIAKEWRMPYRHFEDTERYLEFRKAVETFAEGLQRRFDDPPTWQPDWPVERPDPPDPRPIKIPQM